MDRQRILHLLDMMQNYYVELEEHFPLTEKEYAEDVEKRRFCERTIQLMIEATIDISQLLVKGMQLGLPTSEESLFDTLKSKKILSTSITAKLKKMKKFRNVLIHHYTDIDDALVYENITSHKQDFQVFRKEVLNVLKKK